MWRSPFLAYHLRPLYQLTPYRVLFGHTHRRLIERQNGILLVNPGSIGGRFPARAATYVILDLAGGAVTAEGYEL